MKRIDRVLRLLINIAVVMSIATSAPLVAATNEDPVDSFELLMRRYNNQLYRVARGILFDQDEAMDVVQESWVAAYRSLGSFKGPHGFGSLAQSERKRGKAAVSTGATVAPG